MIEQNEEVIHILLTFDNNYAEHAATAINSIVTSNPERSTVFHIFHAGLRQDIIDNLSHWLAEKNCKIVFYKLTEHDMGHFSHLVRKGDNISIETYFRLLCTNFLPHNLKKILYLEPDMIAVRALDELWAIDLSGYAVAAITGHAHPTRKIRLGLEPNDRYLQSGVLLINLDYWREKNIADKLMKYIEAAEFLEVRDQDTLNAVLKGEWLNIPWKYNATHGIFHTPNFLETENAWHDPEEKKEALENPVIIHYTGVSAYKPWFSNSVSVNKDKFLHYRSGTPYANKKLKKCDHALIIAGPPTAGKGVLVSLLDSHPQVFTFPQWHDMLVDSFFPILEKLRSCLPDWRGTDKRLQLLRAMLNDCNSLADLETYAFKKSTFFAVSTNHHEVRTFNFDYYDWERKFFTSILEMHPPETTFINLIKLFCRAFHENWRDSKHNIDLVDTYVLSAGVQFAEYTKLFKQEPVTRVIYIKRSKQDWLLSWVKRKYEANNGRRSYESIIDAFFKDKHTRNILYVERKCHDIQKDFPQNFMVIRFNDLINNHEKIMPKIADFIGIDMDPCLLKPTLNGQSLTFAGEPVVGHVFDNEAQLAIPQNIQKYAMEKYVQAIQAMRSARQKQVQVPAITTHCTPVLKKWWCKIARVFAPKLIDVLLLAASGTFDAKYYFATYPALLKKSCNPLWGYVRKGSLEGRNPNNWFNTAEYLTANPEVKKSGVNPLVHYLYGEHKE